MSVDKCDEEVFRKGESVAVLDATSPVAETWVQMVAARSGQRVDWHYSGGVAHVLFLGDREKVVAAIHELADELRRLPRRVRRQNARLMTRGRRGSLREREHHGRLLRVFGSGEGLYRAGDPLPEGTLGVATSTVLLDLRGPPPPCPTCGLEMQAVDGPDCPLRAFGRGPTAAVTEG